MHWIGMSIKLSPDNLDTILYNITTLADHDLVFWRCRKNEPHSSEFLCRVVLSGTKRLLLPKGPSQKFAEAQ